MADHAEVVTRSQRTAAKVVGLAYPLSIALIVLAEFGIYGPMAAGDTATAMRNLAASEGLFRLGVACALLYSAGMVVALTALYVVLAPVSAHAALLAAFFRFVYALTWIPIALSLLAVLRLSTGADYGSAFGAEPLQSLYRLQNGTQNEIYYVGLLFWGLAAAVCSRLWLKSRYVPRALPAFGLLASVWCAACGIAYLLDPHLARTVSPWWYDFPLGLFELVLSFWLLFRGLREPGPAGVPAAA